MARIAGIDLPVQKRLYVGLTSIYGIGQERARKLAAKANVDPLKNRLDEAEERLRLATVLPEPLRARIPELTERQLIALRFASDAEVVALVQRALTEKLSGSDIKKSIKTWRPDNFRV